MKSEWNTCSIHIIIHNVFWSWANLHAQRWLRSPKRRRRQQVQRQEGKTIFEIVSYVLYEFGICHLILVDYFLATCAKVFSIRVVFYHVKKSLCVHLISFAIELTAASQDWNCVSIMPFIVLLVRMFILWVWVHQLYGFSFFYEFWNFWFHLEPPCILFV